MKSKYLRLVTLAAVSMGSAGSLQAAALGTAFTYQGQLKQSGTPLTGTADFVFLLFDAASGGIVQGVPINLNAQPVTDGLFTVQLDFGVAPYVVNESRWLEISVRSPAGSGAFTTLSPRQKLTATPFSLATRGIDVDANGNVEGSAGAAFGNDGNVGLGTPGSLWEVYESVLDFSHTLTDFSASENWTPLRSIITVDPAIDLPPFNGIYAHDLETYVPPTNDRDIWYLQGPYMGALHHGTGSIETLGGALTVALSKGDVTHQVGHSVQSYGGANNYLTDNTGLEILGGHYGSGGGIGSNYGLYLWSPDHTSPIGSNFGLYIDDQNVAQDENYAIYAAGGDVYANGRVAMGNEAAIGLGAVEGWTSIYDGVIDFSHHITDFLSNPDWDPFRAIMTIDPDIDLTGANATYIYSHDLITQIPIGNTHDVEYLQGPYLLAAHDGEGTVNALAGALIGANSTGIVGSQTGGYVVSEGSDAAVIGENTALSVISGHNGSGSVGTDYSIFVRSPDSTGTLANHFGLYLEDQDFGVNDSYSIYSAGGKVYINGDVEVTGNISKGGGSFKIDHPLDPENKYLYHSFVESPDMKNIYDGNITTDADGFAEVTMPDWFEALNRDFRYQLTVIGQFAQAIVAEEIADGRFVIRTDKPNVKVSWQVTGIRHDAYADANRIPVEVDKQGPAKGTYLHPQAFGLSNDLRERPASAERDPQNESDAFRRRVSPQGHAHTPPQNGGASHSRTTAEKAGGR